MVFARARSARKYEKGKVFLCKSAPFYVITASALRSRALHSSFGDPFYRGAATGVPPLLTKPPPLPSIAPDPYDGEEAPAALTPSPPRDGAHAHADSRLEPATADSRGAGRQASHPRRHCGLRLVPGVSIGNGLGKPEGSEWRGDDGLVDSGHDAAVAG